MPITLDSSILGQSGQPELKYPNPWIVNSSFNLVLRCNT